MHQGDNPRPGATRALAGAWAIASVVMTEKKSEEKRQLHGRANPSLVLKGGW